MKGCTSRDNGSVISRATPNCKQVMRKALRFVGRFEFMGSSAISSDPSLGLKVFDALDFGTEDKPIQGGRKVKLRCFSKEAPYLEEVRLAPFCTLVQISFVIPFTA